MIKISENLILQPLVDSLFTCGTYIYKCLTTKLLPDLVPYKLPTEKSLNIKIGETTKYPISINLRENPNTYIVGTVGSGKSVCSKSILTSLINKFNPNELELYLCDLKRVELNLFKECEHVKQFSYTLPDVTKTIDYLFCECEKRYDLFMNSSVVDIFEYNKRKRNKLPYKVLFVEEVILLLQDKKKVALNQLTTLLSICRACGIYVFITTQRPSCDVLNPVLKALINNRIVFKCEDSKNSIIALDEEGAENLKGKGNGILKTGSEKTEFQGYFITSNEVKEYTKKFYKKEENQIKVTTKQIGFIENKIIDKSFIDKL